ncbi:prohibitin family protein [Limisphaera ngatamarikiensis]|uniref:Prohibitin family protein n=1 Tax=Limisphaera ngatamarikiensis TaxID=1324935 RepID=A0A6M1RY62_9BACT|nr:prohibitin family protein [Limisphaera ngatamarikiensis]NGO38110.1 prohibitin family protein [Limisphaera ngatamarikiensis]
MRARNPYYPHDRVEVVLPGSLPRFLVAAGVLFLLVLLGAAGSYIVPPGHRGVKVTLGKASDRFLPEGFGFKLPLVTRVVPVSVRQRTMPLRAECFSSDLQQVTLDLRVLYRIPERSVVTIYRQYAGDPFDSLIAPRVQEAVKEVTALLTAEQIVKNRGQVKLDALAGARQKIGDLLEVNDLVIRNIDLSEELERAIEAKMVAEQEAARARFVQMQTEIEAETAVIRAEGEAQAIRIRGEALRLNPEFLRLQLVEKWNGRSPLVVPADVGGTGSGLLLPLGRPGAPEVGP